MARNIIDTIKKIFNNLESQISDEDKLRISPAKKRSISPPSPEYTESNMKVLKNCKVSYKILLNNNTSIFGLTFDNKTYVLILGESQLESEFSPGFLVKSSDTMNFADGFKLFAISEELVTLNSDNDLSLNLIDRLFGLVPDEQLNIEYNINEILSFYPNFEVWEIDKDIFDIKNENDLYRIYILWRISNEKELVDSHKFSLKFLYNTLEQFVKLTQNSNSKHIAKVLYRAISSTSWEHCYLELYRCIENLYTVYHIDYLQDRLKTDTNNIASSLEDIGFKSPEGKDVIKIFRKLNINQYLLKKLKEEVFSNKTSEKIIISQDTLKSLKELVENKMTKNEDDISLLFGKLEKEFNKNCNENLLGITEKMAEKLYEIRCNIAHLKYKHNHVNFNDKQWNEIIFIILNIIEELYDIYGKRLDELV
ncbi:hypothetical protein P9152_05850 [Bacillus subtilis]|uniref:hypothetical protein n=2 Tax=Bacillus subtilis group TaxID=653685 RepID=UPI002DB60DD0|nr:hypothetical protein [Bacillus subtilis]MEC3619697.1 hypothetical protein [Bacillus subtilis]MEC3634364.1 hypothetical protein [Bacillus subtilis]MEC3644802.1 hypothetical protein [Bacillus subtilis]MEC3646085.1 hypothetical protein [Bacillus subtilis]MEC3699956.1 hypothetical protein [Bacillus subtilis]